MTYDVLIIGGGPAGCSAALTLRQRGKTVLMAAADAGALAKARQVDNYPGAARQSGSSLAAAMRAQAAEAGVEIRQASVQRVLPMGNSFSAMIGSDIVSCRGVILATGAPRDSLLPGESELVGQGVSYCATCDGMFYKGKDMAVIGVFPEAVEEANFLATLGRVTYFAEVPHDTAGLNASIVQISEAPKALAREEDKIALQTGRQTHLFDGVFILRPVMALSQLIPEAETENGRMKTDAQGQTSVPLVFAAGDVAGPPYQAAKAAGEGNVAALALCRLLDAEKTKETAKEELPHENT